MVGVRIKANKQSYSVINYTYGLTKHRGIDVYVLIKLIKQQQAQEFEKMIENKIKEQEIIYKEMEDRRTKRMKNSNSVNWGMREAEYRIEHYKEILKEVQGGEGK
jgi:hypothetical protein